MTNANMLKNEAPSKEGHTVNHTIDKAPAFETSVDPIELLETLDDHIRTLHENSSERSTQRVKDDLHAMEIITIPHVMGPGWVTDQPEMHHVEGRRTLPERIGHLFKSKGEWKSERVLSKHLEVFIRVGLPMEFAIRPDAYEKMKTGEMSALILALYGLRATILGMLNEGAKTVGVFRKPDRVLEMNRLKLWLGQYGNHERAVSDNLESYSLCDLVMNAEFIKKE